MTRTMTPDQFQAELDRRGPDLAAWDPDRAAAARLLLDTSAEARAMHGAARRMAALLARPAPDVSDLKARIMAAARASGQAIRDNVVVPFPTRRVVAPAAFALAASLLFGVFAGWSGLITDPFGTDPFGTQAVDDDPTYEFQALMAGDNYDS
ncbi:hypothetical protein L2U69_12960 [Zavarzinia compransoris]|uniref:hypothetical protein n=1 Tax=Zavarzinia marina TaxID=2911065 RepID=UPI001F28364A|nr:hypothetical protein [Zavarzinia marina]MCF4166557.1 hypothetical protein [Zavarzinia marina]